MAKFIHTMIRVYDLEKSIKFYRDVFALDISYRLDFPDFSLVYLRDQESGQELELTLNRGRTIPYTHGDGYGHIAFCVEDVALEHERFKKLGINPGEIKAFHADDGALIARYFFVQDPDGYKIEVLERHGHYQ
ncbi:VOC family protein [Acidocella sp.]|uniref:VOC family protein n=1 Tax=Acidocella sp. TaxID=50710 RepID=UPI003D05C4E6